MIETINNFTNPSQTINLGIYIFLYVYLSLTYMLIGKKLSLKNNFLAWIPGFGPIIIAYKASKMHWWPWLLLIAVIIPLLGIIALITFFVYTIIWEWEMFVKLKRPGWWAILTYIPIVNIIILGIAAFGKNK
ncbi:MAG: hypothetical protein ACMXX7_02455 [Candidatus Woesearchaeota archaeon]